jgi:CheY-like chemotaxis protein
LPTIAENTHELRRRYCQIACARDIALWCNRNCTKGQFDRLDAIGNDAAMARMALIKAKSLKPRGSAKPRKVAVVLVDDDFHVRQALARLLREHGLNVTSFERPSELLLSCLPASDVVLIADIYMPEMSGVALCQELHARGINIPAILITAHRDERALLYGKQIQAAAVLFKPIEEKELLEAIEQASQRASA